MRSDSYPETAFTLNKPCTKNNEKIIIEDINKSTREKIYITRGLNFNFNR
jgi:hypothetical protein